LIRQRADICGLEKYDLQSQHATNFTQDLVSSDASASLSGNLERNLIFSNVLHFDEMQNFCESWKCIFAGRFLLFPAKTKRDFHVH